MKNNTQRETFSTPRELELFSRKGLKTQTGHDPHQWCLYAVKELSDNAVDGCEAAGIAPVIHIAIGDDGVRVADNGPGIRPETVASITDCKTRTSSNEAYVAPDRGRQGNALPTLIGIVFVEGGGTCTITSQGIRHEITVVVDQIKQVPRVCHEPQKVQNGDFGTLVHLDFVCIISDGDDDFYFSDDDEGDSPISVNRSELQLFVDNFAWLNPHLTLTLDFFGERILEVEATNPTWKKWKACQPTSAHWYGAAEFERLVAAYVSQDSSRLVGEFLGVFHGLSRSGKRKIVLDATGLHRQPLSVLINGDGMTLDGDKLTGLLSVMKSVTKPPKPAALGLIGRQHLYDKIAALGGQMDSFKYKKMPDERNNMPSIFECAFAWCPDAEERRVITGINHSPAIGDPFRRLGEGYAAPSLGEILAEKHATADEPVVFFAHYVSPDVSFLDRGKSSISLED